MPSHPPIPPLLSQHISDFPSGSLTLLTSTLGATTNWLLLRIIHAALKNSSHDGPNGVSGETTVVLVSWLRDANFWKDGARKLGIHSQKLQVIDALSNGLGLSADGLPGAEKEVMKAVESAKEAMKEEGRVSLVLDGLDFLIAATACPVLDAIDTVGELREVCFHPPTTRLEAFPPDFQPFRQHVDSTFITACADFALTQGPNTPLETSHSAFLMNMAHQAKTIMSVKGLDTGVAKDISGVIRISRGGGTDFEEDDVEEKECLYFMEADGAVRVFERGA